MGQCAHARRPGITLRASAPPARSEERDMFRDVLVVVDATEDAREALSHAIELAQRERSRMTLITVERRLPACAYLGVAAALPLVIPAAEAEARQVMCEALACAPDDI